MKFLLGKLVSIFMLPGALLVQVVLNIFRVVTKHLPKYEFKT